MALSQSVIRNLLFNDYIHLFIWKLVPAVNRPKERFIEYPTRKLIELLAAVAHSEECNATQEYQCGNVFFCYKCLESFTVK